METLTVTNRTSKALQTVWDGKHYEIGPHETQIHTADVARQFKKWNPQMGSLDPRSGRINYLIAIKEDNDPETPLEQTDAVEVWDRAKLTGARPSEIVPGDNGLYSGQVDWKSRQNVNLGIDGRS